MRAGFGRIFAVVLLMTVACWSGATHAQGILTIQQTATPDPVAPGQPVQYVITVSNTGNATLSSVAVQAVVPNYTTTAVAYAAGYYSTTCTSAVLCEPGQNIIWQLGSLPAGVTRTVSYSSTVVAISPPPDGTSFAALATATSGTTSATASTSAVIQSTPQPTLALAEAPNQPVAGGTLTYVLNYGNSTAGTINATLRFSVPAGTSFASASNGGTNSSGTVSWSLGALAAGASGQQQVTVNVSGSAGSGTPIAASASLVDSGTSQSYARATRVSSVTPAAIAPLTISMSASNDTVEPGATVTYTITVTNRGATNSAASTVYAFVPSYTSTALGNAPSYYSYTCSSANYCLQGQYIYWALGALNPGESQSVQYSVVVEPSTPPPDGTVIAAQALLLSGSAGASVTQDVTIDSSPTLELGITDNPSLATAGGTLTYVLSYGNVSDSAVNATLQLPLPAGTSFVSASNGGAVSGNVVTWNLGALAAGSSGQQLVSLQVAPGTASGTMIYAAANLLATGTLQSYARATRATTVTTPAVSPLALTISATPDTVRPGQTITYTITAANRSLTASASSIIVAVIPQGTTSALADAPSYYSYTCDSATSCQPGEYIYWSLGSIAPGASTSVQYSVVVDASTPPPDGSIITQQVALSTSGLVGGAAASSNVAVNSHPTLQLALADSQNVAAPGVGLTYVLTYGNTAATSSPATTLQFALPPGTTFGSASNGGSLSGSTVSWSLPSLPSGASGQQQVTLGVPSSASTGVFINAVANLLDATTGQSYGRATRVSNVGAAATTPVLLSMSATPDAVTPGATITYTITANNIGANNTSALTLIAVIPPNTTATLDDAPGYYSYSCSSGVACQPGQFIYWSLPALAPGSTTTVHYSVIVNSAAPPVDGTVITAQATIALAGGSGASAIRSVIVQSQPVLQLGLSDSPGLAVAGGALRYRFTYGNSSPNGVSASLQLPLPTGTSFVSASNGGSLAGNTVTWNLGTLPAGSNGQQEVLLQVDPAAASGTPIVAAPNLLDTSTLRSYARATRTSTVTTAAQSPIQMAVAASPDPIVPGLPVTYTLTTTNTGATAVNNVTVYAIVPQNTTSSLGDAHGYYSYSCTSSSSCLPGEFIYWSIGTLPGGGSASVQYAATVDPSSPPRNGTVVHQLAYVTSAANEAAVVQDTAVSSTPTMAVAISDSPNLVGPGSNLTYTLTYGNRSTSAQSPTLQFVIPSGTNLVSATGTPTTSGNLLIWNLGSVIAGGVGQQQVTVGIPSGATGGTPVTTEATLYKTGTQQSLARATDVATINSPQAGAEILVSVAPSPTNAGPGQTITYTITATNVGSLTSSAFSVTGVIPPYTTGSLSGAPSYYSSTCSNASTCLPGQTITWSLAALAAGASTSVHYAVVVNASPQPPAGTVIDAVVSSSIASAISSSTNGIATISGVPIGGGGGGGGGSPATVDAPLPEWALVLMGILLVMSVTYRQRIVASRSGTGRKLP